MWLQDFAGVTHVLMCASARGSFTRSVVVVKLPGNHSVSL